MIGIRRNKFFSSNKKILSQILSQICAGSPVAEMPTFEDDYEFEPAPING